MLIYLLIGLMVIGCHVKFKNNDVLKAQKLRTVLLGSLVSVAISIVLGGLVQSAIPVMLTTVFAATLLQIKYTSRMMQIKYTSRMMRNKSQ